jgi:uncharacterized membrane protein HdeD (DUF308 family)
MTESEDKTVVETMSPELTRLFSDLGKQGWGWLVFAGLVSLVLGGIILFEWPIFGFWIIGLLVAIERMFHDWRCVFVALANRQAAREPAPAVSSA